MRDRIDVDRVDGIRIAVDEFRVGLRRPVVTARGVLRERRGWIVTIAEGAHVGRGEAAPLPGWSSVDHETAGEQLRGWARSPARSDCASEVVAAIDAAERSLAAARAGVPLWRALGGRHGQLRVAHLCTGASPRDVLADARAKVAEGATTLKVKIGTEDDATVLSGLADAGIVGAPAGAPGDPPAGVPGPIRVRLDVNGAWGVSEAAERVDEIQASLGDTLEWIEDPVVGLDDLAELRDRLGPAARVAADEGIRSAADLGRVVDEGLAVAAVVKPPLVGGISAVLGFADIARAGGVDLVVSSLYDGPIGLRAWCHLAAALGGTRAHGLGTAALLELGAAGGPGTDPDGLVPIGDVIVLGN